MSKRIIILKHFMEFSRCWILSPIARKLTTPGFRFQCSLTLPSKVKHVSTVKVSHSPLLADKFLVYSQHTCVRKYAKGAIVKDKKGKGGKPKVQLSDEDLMSVFSPESLKHQMQAVVDKLMSDYVKHMSVRSTGGIDKLPVLIEDEEFPLNEIAQLFRKSPELVVINMTNFPEGIKAVLEALSKSGMNVSSQQDGTVIYVTFPKVTREHRQNLATSAKSRFNKSKEELKDVQNKFVRDVKKQKDSVSEDLIFNATDHIRYVCENYVQEAEKVFKTKEKELLGE